MQRAGYQRPREAEFYQIGGFGCSVNTHGRHPGQTTWKTSKYIAEFMFSSLGTKSGLDLVFGVKPNGAAYLLMPKTPTSPQLPGRVYDGAGFVALSPVHFADAAALEARLDLLSPPARRKKAHNTDAPRDRSAANRGYTTLGRDSVVSAEGCQRAGFEYQRLLIKAAHNELDNSALALYSIAPPPWLRQLKVLSFAHNLWKADHRSKFARGDDLKLLDVGWTVYTLENGLSAQPGSTVHFKFEENSVFTNRDPSAFLYGATEVVATETIRARLQQVLGPNDGDTQSPVLLLVGNEEKALHALRVLGADADRWYHGVEPILGLRPLAVGDEVPGRRDRYAAQRSARSRSPRRDVKPPQLPRPRSPVRGPGSAHPVYVVDVARLYKMVTSEPAADDNIRAMASRLGTETSDGHALGELTRGWCAGNESSLLAMLWYKMVSGNAIDEQRQHFMKNLVRRDDEVKPLASTTNDTPEDDSDEEIDPNDEPVMKAPPPKSKDPYELLDDEDDDY